MKELLDGQKRYSAALAPGGRQFRSGKKVWRSADLAERVGAPGVELDLRLTANGNFLFGLGS